MTTNIVDFVKIDVEGAEIEVLTGASPLLTTKRIRYLYVDYHTSILNRRGQDTSDIHSKLLSYGYVADNTVKRPSGYILYKAL